MLKLSQMCALSGASIYFGIKYEQRKKQTHFDYKPALPIFGSVSAATPVAETRLSPVVTEPEVPIPVKESLQVVPPEPEKGRSRIMEIMRFGFPGMDNIRSHR